MNFKKYLLISIGIFSFAISYSQNNENKNQLKFSTGYNSGALKNLGFAPVYRYDYNGLVYKLNYERTTKKQKLFEIQLDYLSSELKSENIPILNADYEKIGLGISALKKVTHKNNYKLYLGLQSQTSFSVYSKKTDFDTEENFKVNYFDFKQSFGITSKFKYQLNKKQALSTKLTLPIVLLRLSYFDANFLLLNRYQSILWNIDYRYSLSNNFDITIGYDFNYERLQVPITFRELQYQLNLGLNYKF